MMFSKKAKVGFLAFCFCCTTVLGSYEYDPNDFAVEVIDYIEGTGAEIFNDPDSALDRPSLETGGPNYPEMVPVVPVFQPWLANQVVRIGNGGQLTVKFSHPVGNDENNLFGIDFIVFGNAFMVIGNEKEWDFGNPEFTTVNGLVNIEPGIVSVSQDGITWYSFDPNTGPWADDFASTCGYEWDEVNDVWDQQLDPTCPVDPNLTGADLAGMTVAEVIEAYQGSAGGTGFDISIFGLDWIQYVRINDDPESQVTTEIDAVADVSCCGDYRHPYPVGDINKDCIVNMLDFALLCLHWMDCTWDCD